ncbi:MAG: DHHA1 domain-containing protein [Caldilineaceae bacterium]
MTKRLYYDTSYQTSCEAIVTEIHNANNRSALILDQTLFYPTSGGQPNDTGQIAGLSVVDVMVDEAGEVRHLLAEGTSLPQIGERVQCIIDWARRYDHMQQHSGQHLLSQVFFRLFGIETVSVHFGDKESTLDLDVETLDPTQIDEAERVANDLAYQALPIRAYIVDEADLSSVPLRRPPKVSGKIRIVEIDAYDFSACGGTHTHTTAEIAPIKLIKQERRRGQTRLTFLCGKRAMRDYTEKHRLLTSVAGYFSTEIGQSVAMVERLGAQNKELQATVETLTKQLLRYEAEGLLEQAQSKGELHIVSLVEAQRDLQSLKILTSLLTEQPNVVCLVACASGDKATLLFGRSANLQALHMGNLLKQTLQAFGGNGGGRPEFAQGGGGAWSKAQAMLDFAQTLL